MILHKIEECQNIDSSCRKIIVTMQEMLTNSRQIADIYENIVFSSYFFIIPL